MVTRRLDMGDPDGKCLPTLTPLFLLTAAPDRVSGRQHVGVEVVAEFPGAACVVDRLRHGVRAHASTSRGSLILPVNALAATV